MRVSLCMMLRVGTGKPSAISSRIAVNAMFNVTELSLPPDQATTGCMPSRTTCLTATTAPEIFSSKVFSGMRIALAGTSWTPVAEIRSTSNSCMTSSVLEFRLLTGANGIKVRQAWGNPSLKRREACGGS